MYQLELFSDLTLASVPIRSAINDILIHRDGLKLNELPSGAVVGTSQLKESSPAIENET